MCQCTFVLQAISRFRYFAFMSDAIVQKGIPPPPERAARVTQYGIPISPTRTLKKMKAGESILVDTKVARNIMAASAHQCGIKFRTAKEGERYRIWRVEE